MTILIVVVKNLIYIYKLYRTFISVPTLTNALISKQSYYDMYVKNKLEACYKYQISQYNQFVDNERYMNKLNYSMNKQFINEILQHIKEND